MHDRMMQTHEFTEGHFTDLENDTARWTSPAYHIGFGHISKIAPQQPDNDSFRVSAWGLSDGLSHLLADYSKAELHSALDSLIIRQNAHVVVMLNQAMHSPDFDFEMLDQIFIAIDTVLFLPHGLRMHVTCITNIVQVGSDVHVLDKFVAVLDPGEATTYIHERRGMSLSSNEHKLH